MANNGHSPNECVSQFVQHSYLICALMLKEKTTTPKQHSKYCHFANLPICGRLLFNSKALIEIIRMSTGLETGGLLTDNLYQFEKILAAINLNEISGSKTYLKKEGNNCHGEGKSLVYTR